MTPEIYLSLIVLGRIALVAGIVVAGAKLSRFTMIMRGTYFAGATAYIAYAIAAYPFTNDTHIIQKLIGLYGLVAIVGVLAFALWGMTKNPDKKPHEEKENI
ncbi:hypothetical protein Q0M94_19140 (plasmid) [Deinococcus radiomollis]|uniref:hypothetical protein n=1 Tax=Deinococcus radiomollis TaxID=468916 RepID=UPI0038917478